MGVVQSAKTCRKCDGVCFEGGEFAIRFVLDWQRTCQIIEHGQKSVFFFSPSSTNLHATPLKLERMVVVGVLNHTQPKYINNHGWRQKNVGT